MRYFGNQQSTARQLSSV